jgi:hypothetical protein
MINGLQSRTKPQNSEYPTVYGTQVHASTHYVIDMMNLRVSIGTHATR